MPSIGRSAHLSARMRLTSRSFGFQNYRCAFAGLECQRCDSGRQLCRVRVGLCFIDPAAWCLPGHDAGLVLGQVPASSLFRLVMPATEGREVTLTRGPALVIGHRVVQVSPPGRAPAAGE